MGTTCVNVDFDERFHRYSIDRLKSLEALNNFTDDTALAQRVATEVQWLRATGINMVLSDAAFLAW